MEKQLIYAATKKLSCHHQIDLVHHRQLLAGYGQSLFLPKNGNAPRCTTQIRIKHVFGSPIISEAGDLRAILLRTVQSLLAIKLEKLIHEASDLVGYSVAKLDGCTDHTHSLTSEARQGVAFRIIEHGVELRCC